MSKVLEKWNEKWKNQRVAHIFAGFSDEIKDFFMNSEIINGHDVVHSYEYSDEGYYSDIEIEIKYKENIYTLGVEYGNRGFCIDGEDFDETFKIRDYEENRKIDEFLAKFDFIKMVKELEEEFLNEGINERKSSIKATVEEIIEEHGNFIYVLSDGRRIRETGLESKTSHY